MTNTYLFLLKAWSPLSTPGSHPCQRIAANYQVYRGGTTGIDVLYMPYLKTEVALFGRKTHGAYPKSTFIDLNQYFKLKFIC